MKESRRELLEAAKRIGITEISMRRRVELWGKEKAFSTPRQTRTQAGRAGANASNWRHNFKLPGSLS